MPINDAKRFNQRTAAAASVGQGALVASLTILRALRDRDLLSGDEAQIIVDATVDAMGEGHRKWIERFIANEAPPDDPHS